MSPRRASTDLTTSRRMVVKVGSSLLVDEKQGTVHRQWLESLLANVAEAHQAGKEVLLVSSGAIAVGRRCLNLASGHLRLEEKQAAAATGMVRLAHAYQEALARHGLTVAQVLLTLEDSENRRRYMNTRNTLNTLLGMGAVPLVNENDTVATDEIRFGDNDRLAARVAGMVSADTLVLLSDIDGLYTADPRRDKTAAFIPEVRQITPEIEAMAGSPNTSHGSGGMVTKLAAGRICLQTGCSMVIAQGAGANPLKRIAQGKERHTWFLPQTTPLTARKRWIFGALEPGGVLMADAGAQKALAEGCSLLPAGVMAVKGDFPRGEAVRITDMEGREIARGLAAYPADDARRIMGHKSDKIETLLGYRGKDELIHRDDLVLV